MHASFILAFGLGAFALARPQAQQPPAEATATPTPSPSPSFVEISDGQARPDTSSSGTVVEAGGIPNINITRPAALDPANALAKPTCFDSGKKLNIDACDALIQKHLPSLVDPNDVGTWSPKQTYRWDLKGYKGPGGFKANNCVVVLATLDNSINATYEFPAMRFMVQANSIAHSLKDGCAKDGNATQYGGQQPLSQIPNFYVKVLTEA